MLIIIIDEKFKGGTFIGTARCMAFMKREGRKIAVKNLLKRNIDRLVIIGGDGSLTGAHYLHKEWPELVKEIVQESREERSKTITDTAVCKFSLYSGIISYI